MGNQIAPPELVIQSGHSSGVTCAVFNSDHHWLASGSSDYTVKLWDVESGRELRVFRGHTNYIRSLALSRDEMLLASGSTDQSIRIWDVSSGRTLVTLTGHENPVDVVLFSPDGRWLFSGSSDNTIRVWEVASGTQLKTLRPTAGAVTALAMTSDGKTLASGSADKSIRLWDTTTWTESRTLNKHADKISALVFDGAGRHLISASQDGAIIEWELPGGKDRSLSKGGAGGILTLLLVSESELWSIATNGATVVWDITTGKQKRTVAQQWSDDKLAFAVLSNDGTLVAASPSDLEIELRTSGGKSVRRFSSHSATFYSLAISGDGKYLAAGGNDATIRLWQTSTGRELPRLSGHSALVKAVAFSPDSRLLASVSQSGEIKVWQLPTGTQTYSGTHDRDRLLTVAFSPDGKLLASGGTGGVIHLLDVDTGQNRDLEAKLEEITGLTFIPNSSLLASASVDKKIRLWDLTNGTVQKAFELTAPVHAIAGDSAGTMVAAGTADGQVSVIRLDSGTTLILGSHSSNVYSVAFSQDGSSLVSGGRDQSIRVWELKTRKLARTLAGAAGDVNGIVFGKDSRLLISANGDGSITTWDAQIGVMTGVMVSVRDSDDWLVATPGGLFDGSHAAWNLLLWRFEQSTFKFAPVESFFSEFYYPGLLAEILANKNPKPKQEIIVKDRRQPKVELTAATGNPATKITSSREVKITLQVAEAPADREHSFGSGARDLRLFRNGLLVQTWPGDVLNESSRQTFETTVKVVAGRNEFTAYAFNRDNVKSLDKSLDIAGAESLRREGTAYLIVVGVGKYANSQFNLNYTVADATEMAAQLRSQQELMRRYRPIEVISLLDTNATKENILLALKLLAGTVNNPPPGNAASDLSKLKRAEPEDAVIFYFSGHGAARDDRFYMVPQDLGYQGPRSGIDDSGWATIFSHSVSDQDLEEALKAVDADQLLLIIDACYSGQVLVAADERYGPMNSKGLAQLAYEKGMYVLTASQRDDVAYESAPLKHSYLAHALVEEGIKQGSADSNHDGQIVLSEWFDYATERVPRIRRGEGQAGKELDLVYLDEKRVQRPQVFNMREGAAEKFIVAKVAVSSSSR